MLRTASPCSTAIQCLRTRDTQSGARGACQPIQFVECNFSGSPILLLGMAREREFSGSTLRTAPVLQAGCGCRCRDDGSPAAITSLAAIFRQSENIEHCAHGTMLCTDCLPHLRGSCMEVHASPFRRASLSTQLRVSISSPVGSRCPATRSSSLRALRPILDRLGASEAPRDANSGGVVARVRLCRKERQPDHADRP
jgi:hypothetical protein